MRGVLSTAITAAITPAITPAILTTITAMLIATVVTVARAQEGQFLDEADAPKAVFPDATRFDREEIVATDEIRARMKATLAGVEPSVWEPRYVAFHAWEGEAPAGTAYLIEEIGKHRPITFIVGIGTDGRVHDVAVVAYREAQGGEIRQHRFLAQYQDKGAADSLTPSNTIINIAGATLSVEAASRAVKKALAVATVMSSAPLPKQNAAVAPK